jgi:cell division transport system permease protein
MGEFSLPPRVHVQFQDITQVSDVFEIFKNARYTEVIGAWDGKGEQEFVRLVERLLALRQSVQGVAQFLVFVFLGGGVLLMVNTFRLVIFSRRNEIFIARLVGADPGFITGPFLMEGALLGLFSAMIAILIFTFILREIEMLPGGEIFLYLWNHVFLWELLAAGSVGVLGAWISTRKYLFGKFEG